MKTVRFGIIGVGGMGGVHAEGLRDGKVPRATLAAVCDHNAAAVGRFPSVPGFASVDEFFRVPGVDAVVIATPHPSHAALGATALATGRHVLVEKPIASHKADAERLLAAHVCKDQAFGVMFNQRTDPYFQTLRQLVRSGELGAIRRVHWTATDWFRTEAYYRSGSWRATWAGEGGGVLLNQCPHQLDLFQWIFGMPTAVRAFCRFGRYHHIEVEDDVTAFFEYPDGMTAVLVASTGEAPGTQRLEVVADRGKVVLEGNELRYTRNVMPASEWSRTHPERFAAPPAQEVPIPLDGHGPQHLGMLTNFVDAICDGVPLLAPAAEGLFSLELANACLLSTWENRSVPLPIDAAFYEERLQEKIAASDRRPPAEIRRVSVT